MKRYLIAGLLPVFLFALFAAPSVMARRGGDDDREKTREIIMFEGGVKVEVETEMEDGALKTEVEFEDESEDNHQRGRDVRKDDDDDDLVRASSTVNASTSARVVELRNLLRILEDMLARLRAQFQISL